VTPPRELKAGAPSSTSELRPSCGDFPRQSQLPDPARRGCLRHIGLQVGWKDRLTDDKFVTVQDATWRMASLRERHAGPSSESMLHFAIYRARRDVQAVFHGQHRKFFDVQTGRRHPETREKHSYGSIELVQASLKSWRCRLCHHERHGSSHWAKPWKSGQESDRDSPPLSSRRLSGSEHCTKSEVVKLGS